jgi:hypothetical protein
LGVLAGDWRSSCRDSGESGLVGRWRGSTLLSVDVLAALDRLDGVVGKAPELARSLRGPATDGDIDALSIAVEPLAPPPELVALLRWSDGQHGHGSPWWPALEAGTLLDAQSISYAYTQRCSGRFAGANWPPLLPFCGEQLSQASIELSVNRLAVIALTPYDDRIEIVAPSLAAVLEATSDLIESSHPLSPPDSNAGFAEWDAQRLAIVGARYAREGCDNWDHAPSDLDDPRAWPAEWLEQRARREAARP